jgi:ABC-type dipeptide/oligopeptide/nickel transport system ATPase component
VSIVFQGAMNSLNPVISVRAQLEDVFTTHRPSLGRRERRAECAALLERVGVDPSRLSAYPHELSGGMRQRVMIAMAMALSPQLMIMDVPTMALDVVVQREILSELARLRDELGFAVLFITHDLPLLLEISDRIAVMRDGSIVELQDAIALSGASDHRRAVQMVFQDPFASLNPYHTVGHHLARQVRLHHRGMSAPAVDEMVLSLLERVRLTPATSFVGRRRTNCRAASGSGWRSPGPSPGILVADEPVSMLDVSIRLGILSLLATLQRESSLGVLYITHDLATARHFSDEILVLLRGRVVERGAPDDVILRPRHPYTQTLAAAAPDPERRLRG